MTGLWEELQGARLPILVYGMGNGGDKLLDVCAKKGVGIAGVFCSDGFERGKSFHGFPVIPYSEAKKKYGDFAVLVAFASSRDDVLAAIGRVAKEQKLYIPDLPVAGDTLFDKAFYENHRAKFDQARALFQDERSKEVFDAVIRAKLYGRFEDFFVMVSTPDEDFDTLLHPAVRRFAADLGAYDGDSARFLLGKCPKMERITAFEPDEKTFARLQRKTAGLPVLCLPYAAWDKEEDLVFTRIGNRGSGVGAAGKKQITVKGMPGDAVFAAETVDFLWFDVEGAEKRALKGLKNTVARDRPEMLVSCYHRPEDLFDLPLYIKENYPFYKLYLRRHKGVPAWDVNLYCTV